MSMIYEPTSFAQQQPYFARVADAVFWCDMERVKVLIDLYEHFDCLWYVKYQEYKNASSDVVISTAVAYGMARETCLARVRGPYARVSTWTPVRTGRASAPCARLVCTELDCEMDAIL